MMTCNDCLNEYIKNFGYKEVLFNTQTNKRSFMKSSNKGFIIIECLKESKIVDFYFNEEAKRFKKSELLMCALDNIPAAWEEENVQ